MLKKCIIGLYLTYVLSQVLAFFAALIERNRIARQLKKVRRQKRKNSIDFRIIVY